MNKHYRKYLESKGVDTSKIKPKKKKLNKNEKMNKNTNKLNNYTKSVKYAIYTDFYSNSAIDYKRYVWYYCIYNVETGDLVHEATGTASMYIALPFNVAGELSSVLNAVKYCCENNYTNICINYHYEGVKGWVNGWKTNSEHTKFYSEMMNKYKHIKYTFSDIRSHMAEKGRQHSKNKAKSFLLALYN